MFHEHKNTKLNHFSPILKVANFGVLQLGTQNFFFKRSAAGLPI